MRVFLLGFMASGKSTVGEKLAKSTGLSFIDLDDFIEKEHNSTIRFLMYELGPEKFREFEKQALLKVINDYDNVIVSTGGGTPCYFDNLKTMNDSGTTVYLEVDVPTLVSRLMNSKKDRPLVWGKSKEDLTVYAKDLLSNRQDFYRQAKHTINGKNIKVEDVYDLLGFKI